MFPKRNIISKIFRCATANRVNINYIRMLKSFGSVLNPFGHVTGRNHFILHSANVLQMLSYPKISKKRQKKTIGLAFLHHGIIPHFG